MTSWIVVEDLVLSKQVAGHAALELVNTRAGWEEGNGSHKEYLVSLDHLRVLARLNGLLDDERSERLRLRMAQNHGEADQIVRRARWLRSLLRDVLVGVDSSTQRRRLAAAVTQARSRQQLSIGQRDARWEYRGPPALSEPLDAFLVAAADLLMERPRIDACPGQDCGWLFVNRSGRRRWCQMAVCGNRAKQASHLARSRTTA